MMLLAPTIVTFVGGSRAREKEREKKKMHCKDHIMTNIMNIPVAGR